MTMKIEKYVVILSSENGDKTHLKMNVNRESEIVEIYLGEQVKTRGGTLYVIGEEITKQQLYNTINDYKVRLCANNDIDLMLNIGGKVYVGSTGRTPKIRTLKALVERYENDLKMQAQKVVKCADKNGENGGGFHCEKNGSFEVGNGRDKTEKLVCENDENSVQKQEEIFSPKTIENDGLQNENNECLMRASERVENDDKQGSSIGQFGGVSDNAHNITQVQNAEQVKGEIKGANKDDSMVFAFDSVRFDGSNFYLSVKPQLDEIFVCYPEEELLNNLVPNSKWAHISTPDGYYVVGLVLDGDSVSYICYGVPSTDRNMPPQEIAELAVWLSDGGSEGKGYWLIYQDALTGKCLK